MDAEKIWLGPEEATTEVPLNEEPSSSESPILTKLDDHFTLPIASNLVRFRNKKNAARVYQDKGVQMVMEETYDEDQKKSVITVRRLSDETSGVQFLRLIYSIVCALFTGFLFVFCLQVLLFLVLDLAVESGATELNASVNVGTTIGVVLAIIMFVFAFAEALVIAGHYIADMWSGHFLAKQFIFKKFNDVTIEWIFFTAFLLLPLVVMCVALLAEATDWWSWTAIVWFGCILAFFCLFCFNIVYYEVKAAYDFCKNRHDTDSDAPTDILKRCLLLRQSSKYSGKTLNSYLARSAFTNTEDTEVARGSQIFEDTRTVQMGWWARITKSLPDWAFRNLDEPYRLYTLEDVQDFRPFLTRNTWGLEKIFCREKNSRYIAIVQGPGALTQSQLRSSLICSLIGTGLIILIVVSFLVWFQLSGAFVAFAFFVSLFMAWGALSNTRHLFKVGKDLGGVTANLKDAASDDQAEEAPTEEDRDLPQESDENPSEAVYLVSEYMRETEMTDAFGWFMFRVEVAIFYVYPLVTLFMINWNMAVLFFICVTTSGIRHYVNAAVVIEETGNIELVGGETPEEIWENKSRLSEIVGSVTAGKSRRVFLTVLGAGGFGFLAIFLGAVGSSVENTNTETFTYLQNFYYPPQADDMRYPTCTLSNMNGGFGSNSTLADYAFLSSVAYLLEENTQPALDEWFGIGKAKDESDYVRDFREENDPDNLAVFFKMVSFSEVDLGMLVVRGTSNNWDMLADTQLWSAAALMQGLRAVLPAGEIWTPIIDRKFYS